MKHLKKFDNNSSYEEYILSEDFITPNVSYVEENSGVYYNPFQSSNNDPYEDYLKLVYKVENTDEPTNLFYYYYWDEEDKDGLDLNLVKSLIVDGTEISPVHQYLFESTGEHEVYVKFVDNTTIPKNAFKGCTGLINVIIPNSVQTIGDMAFYECTGLESIDIPNSVTSIDASAFFGCTGLESIDIPNSVTTIGVGAFSGCKELTSVTIGSAVQAIGVAAFYGCTGLTSIDIPNSVQTIGDMAFEYCEGLTSVTIGSGVQTIGERAFQWCTELSSITSLATTASSIQNFTFYGVKTGGVLRMPVGATGYDAWLDALGTGWTIQTISE